MRPANTSQRGLTLIELMVAVVLGLVVLLVVGQIYLSGRQSYRTQTGFGGMQENGRFALYFLQRDIRMAGFPRVLGPGGSLPVLASFNVANTRDGGGNASDQIEVQYNSFGTTVATDAIPADLVAAVTQNNTNPTSVDDCLGQESGGVLNADGSRTVTNRYFVDATGNLQCLGSGNDDAPQPIIPGVESMQILYGEDDPAFDPPDSPATGDTYANVFRRADQVVNWDRVVAVRIGLLINSQPEQVFDTPDTAQYAVLDTVVDAATLPAASRRFSRRVFTTTIQLRNRSTL